MQRHTHTHTHTHARTHTRTHTHAYTRTKVIDHETRPDGSNIYDYERMNNHLCPDPDDTGLRAVSARALSEEGACQQMPF